ncbi:GntR family transcriptional regulator [Abyssisolibacter fermentans]|uniref:GntR family transcriptional regulator n=1 Tax=Abyssisolibacter fermentans TaxID=1766203 RepID=UPI00082B7DDC|nr:GntR family transcriptional regulator [Abyssisolibacter fermentans]
MQINRGKEYEPLYVQLKEKIKEDIKSGKYKIGDLIPTELEFQKKYNISRITARQAINGLAKEGYVKRVKGKGTLVQSPIIEEPLTRIKSFTNEMKDRGIKASTKWAEITITKAFDDIPEKLKVEKGEEIYRVRRIRCADGEPIVLFDTYFKMDLKLELNNDLYYGSLYEFLDDVKGIKIKKVKQHIGASIADEHLSEYLDIEKGNPVLTIKRQSFDKNESIIEYTKGFYIANRYEYYIEF